jgi:hypothetical protein
MSDVIDLSNRRKPVTYTITITHHWGDRLEFFVEGVSDDPRSQRTVADAMQRFGGFQKAADALHKDALLQCDALMGAVAGTRDAKRLSELAEIIQAYENVRFPI